MNKAPGKAANNQHLPEELLLWQFLNGFAVSTIEPSRWLVGLGCSDGRVAEACADYYHRGVCQKILMSGGVGRLTQHQLQTSEAETFAKIARQKAVPQAAIVQETQATNTAQNVRNSMAIINNDSHSETDENKSSDQADPVNWLCRNIFRPRVYAVIKQQWPELKFGLASPAVDYTQYCKGEQELARQMMVGEIDRLLHYPQQGWQIAIEIPEPIRSAYQYLKQAGYQRYLVA